MNRRKQVGGIRRPAGALIGAGILLLLLLPPVLLGSCRTAGPAGAGPSETPPAEQGAAAELLPLDPQVTSGTLENGLRYFIRHNSEPEGRAELRLVVDAGSLLEEENQRGLAHFLEHMAFNGTRNFRKQEIIDFLESVGMRFGPEVNAYTGYEETVYLLTVPSDDAAVMEKGFRILEDWAHQISFEEEEVVAERPVIVEEWRLGRGAEARMRDRQLPVLYHDSRYAERSPIGELAVIEAVDADQLKRFYKDWYRPDLMTVVAVGDFDPAWVEEEVRRSFSRLQAPEKAPARPRFPVPTHREPLFAPASDPEATSARVGLYIKHPASPLRTTADFRTWLTEALYNGMLNRRLEEVGRQPEAPFLAGYSFSQRSIRPTELYVLAAQVQETRIAAGLEALLTEAERVRRHGFTATELARQKAELLDWMENSFRERDNIPSDRWADALVDYALKGEALPSIELEHELAAAMVPAIGLEEVNSLSERWLTAENRVILANAPEKAGLEVPDAAALAGVFDRVEGKSIAAYEDRVRERPLLAETPAMAAVTEETEIPELGVTRWRLANGVQVILKPTDFRSDEVLMAAISPGGHSLVSDADYVPAVTAAGILAEGGLADFSLTELEKKLAGVQAEVTPWIGDLYEGLRGSAVPEDLESLFQLVYLTFTRPRLDEEGFRTYRERLSARLANRASSPEAVFFDTVQTLITRDHPRGRPWTAATLDELDARASLRVYRDRFADAGDFTFFLVGSFTPEEIRPLISRYLGSLPAAGRVESWRDVGMDPPRGLVEATVRKGREPKSRVEIIFSGEQEWSLKARLEMAVLAEILDIRFRELLREEAGGTYSVGVEAFISHYPDQEYQVAIGFGTAPEQAEKLTALIFTEIEALKAAGPAAADLVKVHEILKRERETALRENAFWLQQLQFYAAHGLDPRLLLSFGERLQAVSAEDIRQAAVRTLDRENTVRVFLYPESPGESD
jgi:zinc protease